MSTFPDTYKAIGLRDPFPASMVGTRPQGGVQLSYVGHGAVTSRLLDVDPEWTWEPLALDREGLPMFERDSDGNRVGFWIKLTVNGVTRLGYGDCPSGQKNAEKVLIGDALRNAAMRFGVALDLWIKGQSEDHESRVVDGARNRPQAQAPRPQGIDRSKFLAAVEAAGLTEQAVCEAASRGQRFAVDQFDDDEGDVLRAAFKRLKDAAEGTITSPPGGTGAEPTPPGAALPEGAAA